MTTDPHLDSDIAWLDSTRPMVKDAWAIERNARIDRLIARAKGGQTPTEEGAGIIQSLLAAWPDTSVPPGPLCVRAAHYVNSAMALAPASPVGTPVMLLDGDGRSPLLDAVYAEMLNATGHEENFSGYDRRILDLIRCAVPWPVEAPASPVGAGLDLLREVADQIFDRWDKDQRAGKLLAALAGRSPGYDPRVDQIRQALASPALEGWLPIETAPMDGTHILLAFGQDAVAEGWYDDNDREPRPWKFVDTGAGPNPTAKGFVNSSRDGNYGPSRWQPLPAPPAAIKAEGE